METGSTFTEIWRFREVIKNFVSQDLKVKYRRSVLGFFWSLLNPLLQMLVISIVFSMLFRFSVRNYALYVLSGLLPWSFMSTSISGCSMCIVSAEGMLKRQYFPKFVFPISVVMQNLVTFFLSLTVLLLVLAPVTGFKISAALLILPLSFLCIVCVSLGIGALAAVLTVHFRDTQHLVSVFLSAWFYLTPIIWPLEAKHPAKRAQGAVASQVSAEPELVDMGPVPHKYRFYCKLNPMYSVIEMFHRPIYDAKFPTLYEFLGAIGVAAVSLIMGLVVFRRYENTLVFNL